MTNLELQAEAWHNATFGKKVDLPATYRKLLEEVGELGEALMHQDRPSIEEEAGDVALVLMHIVREATGKGIIQLAELALDKCERRRYAEQGGKGTKPQEQRA